ncbi:hypothetical protein HID58_007536, partial [Brassica napus]
IVRQHNAPLCRGTNVCYSVFYNLANKLDEKLVLTGYEHKVIVATNINPKLVGVVNNCNCYFYKISPSRLFLNDTSLHIFILTKSVSLAKTSWMRMLVLPKPQPSMAVSRNWNLLQLQSLMHMLMIPMSSITGSRYLCTLEVVRTGSASHVLNAEQNFKEISYHLHVQHLKLDCIQLYYKTSDFYNGTDL